ncbi:MAG: hypothetical protein AB1390_11235 [Nitrospirota bacterium]
MERKGCLIVLTILLIFSLNSCKEKEKPPATEVPGPAVNGPIQTGPIQPRQMPPGQDEMASGTQQQFAAPATMPKAKSRIVVPDSVKNKWSEARIVIEDKVAKTKKEFTVKLNSDFSVPNSNLRIHVGEFLPDFKMDGLNLTSASNTPNNPALAIKVYEGDRQIFPAPGRNWGWLFAKVPSIHPFEHQKYGIFLKEGVRKG